MAKASAVTFRSSDNIELQGKVWTSRDAEEIDMCVVCVHPWTILGGAAGYMEHYGQNLVRTRQDIAVLTFDLRGSGRSGGSASIFCFAEVNDVLGACRYMHDKFGKPIIILASSAGAAIGGTAAFQGKDQYDIIGYVGIGYTFGWFASLIFYPHFHYIRNFSRPKLFIQGSLDGFCSPSQLQSVADSMTDAEVFIINGVGHFELEHSTELSRVIATKLISFIESIKS